MRKSGGEPMSCGYSPTPPAACAWSAHSPSKPTKTGSKPTATSIWTNCASRRKPNYAKPHDQHHDRQFAELDAHNLFNGGDMAKKVGFLGLFCPSLRHDILTVDQYVAGSNPARLAISYSSGILTGGGVTGGHRLIAPSSRT